jgi:hypothetical protein
MASYLERKLNGNLTQLWDMHQSLDWGKWFNIGDPPFPFPLKKHECAQNRGEFRVHDMDQNDYKIYIKEEKDRFSLKIEDLSGRLCLQQQPRSYVKIQNCSNDLEARKIHKAAQASFAFELDVYHV